MIPTLSNLRQAYAGCMFIEKGHRYRWNGERMESVTSVVKRLSQPFDREYWTTYTAAKSHFSRVWPSSDRQTVGTSEGTFAVSELRERLSEPSAEDVGREWDELGLTAALHGTQVHAFAENYMLGKIVRPVHQPLHRFFSSQPDYRPLALEVVTACQRAGVAGQVDALMLTPEGRVLLRDFKTNKELKRHNPHAKMKPPVQHLDDCNWSHYVIQLNLYRALLERKGFRIDLMEIVHAPSTMGKNEDVAVVDVPRMDVEGILLACEERKASSKG